MQMKLKMIKIVLELPLLLLILVIIANESSSCVLIVGSVWNHWRALEMDTGYCYEHN